MSYIQGFVIPVPSGKKDAYRELAAKTAPIFLEYGALRMVEGWGDDVPHGSVTDFHKAVQAGTDETVVFSWIIWPDKATYQAAQQKMVTDARMQPSADMPFDGKRMIFGGFAPLFEAGE